MSSPGYAPVYPVRVDASLDPQLSRWLWLVKWFLAIPHYFVLALLWVAFAVLSVVAFFAILFTGRYPRSVFDFNVGVLRWSWRVAYYAYGGLGTDRYPPFSLSEEADYPAHLEVAYPDHLSRGLVLVKWWLLAIPHYLVVGLFLGGGAYAASNSDEWAPASGTGLIGLLVLVAAVVLLFTGSYPRPVFDLVLGLNRWVLRVAAYAGLMTDAYPPFRLDMGGTDPASGGDHVLTMAAPASTLPPPAAPSEAPGSSAGGTAPAPPPTGSRWGAGRVIAVITGSVLVLTSTALLAAGGVLRLADGVVREDGYLMTGDVGFVSPGYAVRTESAEIHGASDLPERWLGTVKVTAASGTDNGVFLGIASTDDVDRYLEGVAVSTVDEPYSETDRVADADFVDGGSPPVAPLDSDIWVAQASGAGLQELTWEPTDGDWTLVVMNGEGTTPVDADVAVGAELPVLDDVAVVLLVVGLVLLAGGVGLLVAALRRRTS